MGHGSLRLYVKMTGVGGLVVLMCGRARARRGVDAGRTTMLRPRCRTKNTASRSGTMRENGLMNKFGPGGRAGNVAKFAVQGGLE